MTRAGKPIAPLPSPRTQDAPPPQLVIETAPPGPLPPIRLAFAVRKLFLLGGPVGPILLARQAQNEPLPHPRVKGVFNIAYDFDPMAFRLEPLLHARFRHIGPVLLPQFAKPNSGDGSGSSSKKFRSGKKHKFLHQTTHSMREALQKSILLTENLPVATTEPHHIQARVESVIGEAEAAWWGTARVDYQLQGPKHVEKLSGEIKAMLSKTCYWESVDVFSFIAFTLLTLTPMASLPRAPTIFAFAKPITPFKVPEELDYGQWHRKHTRLLTVTQGRPNHRLIDTIACSAKEPVEVIGKFSYGSFGKDLKREDVAVYVLPQPQGEWLHLGTIQTSRFGQHNSRGPIKDDGGRVFFRIPPVVPVTVPSLLPVRMVVKGDLSQAFANIFYLHRGTKAVVFNVDGAVVTSSSLSAIVWRNRCLAQPNALKLCRLWVSMGYMIVYVSGRPDSQKNALQKWLVTNKFPPGLVCLSGGMKIRRGKGVALAKGLALKQLAERGLVLAAAYGSSKNDLRAFLSVGILPRRVYLRGKWGGQLGTLALPEGYSEEHIRHVSSTFPYSDTPLPELLDFGAKFSIE
eukprot:GCRY01006238.1.p1 GENE.GCRY01006238.1~~GCRY01006238.1.p1  ORF type:complete len:573 (-),score=171.20 GCRY01006238.1:54-1772(-)